MVNTLNFTPLVSTNSSNNSLEYIPWKLTSNIIRAQEALVRMFESLPTNSAEKSYILENCTNALQPLTGNSGLPINILNPETIKNSLNTHSLNDGLAVASVYKNAGVYAFIDPDNGDMNIGSCTNFPTRLNNHFSDYKHGDTRPLYKRASELGGLNLFNWHVCYTQPNHVSEFLIQHPEKIGDLKLQYILNSFTQYDLYTREQALISYYCTNIDGLNGPNDVTFTFSNFTENQTFSNNLRATELNLYYSNGSPVSEEPCASINKASELLGRDRRDISRYINLEGHFIYSPNLGDNIRIENPLLEMRTGNIRISPYERPDGILPDGRLPSELPGGSVIGFAEDCEVALNKSWDTPSDLARDLGFEDKYYKVTRHINKNVLVKAGPKAIALLAGLSFTFWQNPLSKGNSKRIKCTTLNTGLVKYYSSLSACLKEIAPGKDESNIRKNYVNKNKPYKGYLIQYLNDIL